MITSGRHYLSPFNIGDLNKGLAGISMRYSTRPLSAPARAAGPVAAIPSPMVRFTGKTNRQSILELFIGPDTSAGQTVSSETIEAAGEFISGWLDRHQGDEARRRQGFAALTVINGHLETDETLFALRNALIPA